MELYTERNGMRKPIEKTYNISADVYDLLFNTCEKYKDNLMYLFNVKCHHDFTDKDYIEFNEQMYRTRIKLKIPTLFDEFGYIIAAHISEEFDQYAILDLIEFYAENIKDVHSTWNSERYKDFKNYTFLNTSNIVSEFIDEVNEIFVDAGLLYKLTFNGTVERIVENTPLTKEMEIKFSEVKEKGVRELLEEAIESYKTPSPSARQDSVEKIWDAFERLKTYYTHLNKKDSASKIVRDIANNDQAYINLFDKEFKELSGIGNNFRIRHHETDKTEINDVRYYDYFFNRCLTLIALAVQYLE